MRYSGKQKKVEGLKYLIIQHKKHREIGYSGRNNKILEGLKYFIIQHKKHNLLIFLVFFCPLRLDTDEVGIWKGGSNKYELVIPV